MLLGNNDDEASEKSDEAPEEDNSRDGDENDEVAVSRPKSMYFVINLLGLVVNTL